MTTVLSQDFRSGPLGIALGGAGRVYVADGGNDRIQVFETDGTFVREWGSEGSGPGEFNYPNGIALDGAGRVYVADTGNDRIQVFEADGAYLGSIGGWGSREGQLIDPRDIAIDALGNLYVVDRSNHRIQKFTPAEIGPRQHKAIIVAGSGPELSGPHDRNPIWAATEKLARQAKEALGRQAIVKAQGQIRFLTAGNTAQDLDNNGQFDDLLPATLETLRESLTEWARDADDLILYLIGHGKSEQFLLNADDGYQWLDAETLAGWLETLQAQIPGEIIIVLDACHAGSFLERLAAAGRVVLASSQADQLALFGANDASFSHYFWNRVGAGGTLRIAFESAKTGIADFVGTENEQLPQADADGDGIATDFDLVVQY